MYLHKYSNVKLVFLMEKNIYETPGLFIPTDIITRELIYFSLRYSFH